MATNTDNYSLTKPSTEDFYDIEVQNENMEIIDRELKELETDIEDVQEVLNARMADAEYQTAMVSGTQIHIARQSLSKRLYFKLIQDLTGGVITISLDSGDTLLPLKDIDGNYLTALDKGYWEVVDSTDFFTLRPREGGDIGFYRKYAGGDINITIPISVFSSNYTTSASARPQVLNNGWIIVPVADETNKAIIIRVSKSNGVDWETLCTISNGTVNSSDALSFGGNFSCTSSGNYIYILCWRFSSGGSKGTVCCWTINAPVQTNTNVYSTKVDIEEQNTIGSGCYIAIGSESTLHAAWSSKNVPYSNSFNIRYSKSSTGGATWDTVIHVTKQNTSGDNFQKPVLILRNDVVFIICENKWGTTYEIDIFNNTSGWTPGGVTNWGGKAIFAMSSYVQMSPSATVTNDGVVHVVWAGYDSTDTKSFNLKYSYSSDWGNTWSAMAKVTTGGGTTSSLYDRTYPCITSDSSNKLWIACSARNGTSTIENLMFISNTGDHWVSKFITSYPNGSEYFYPSVCDNYNSFSSPLCVYQDNQASAIKFIGVSAASDITLVSKIKQGSYIYSNENVQLKYDTPINITINRSTPINVVNSPYATSAYARPQVLSNGWIVATVYDSTAQQFRFFVSKDNGSSYQQLCYKNTAASASPEISVCSYGTKIFALHTVRTGINGVSCILFDAATVANTEVPYVSIETQTAVGQGGYITVDSTGTLHAAWSSKNSSYPNSLNIRYSKSADGGVTWTAPTQVTTENNSAANYSNPCIVTKNNKPAIIFVQDSVGLMRIWCNMFNGVAWNNSDSVGRGVQVHNGGAYVQFSPSATVTSNGAIHVVWHGLDSTDNAEYNIRYSKSTDGGVTWSTMTKLTTGNTWSQYNPCISADSSDRLYVVWRGRTVSSTSYSQVHTVKYDGIAWSTRLALTSATNDQFNPSICDNYKNFVEPLTIYQDNQASSVKFRGIYTVNANQQIIPPIDKATSESQLVALGNGVLKTYGTEIKRYTGHVSRKSKGW